jgi:hypothetical protein
VARPETQLNRRDRRQMRASVALVQDYLAHLRRRTAVAAPQSALAEARMALRS